MTARVLVVDDIEANVKLLEARLTVEYFETLTARNGPEALQICASEGPDVVLLDVMMPGMDGLEAYKKILELHPGQKALIASGFSETDRVKETHIQP